LTWLTFRFQDSSLEWMLMKFEGKPAELFNKFGGSKNGKMSYRMMQTFMEQSLGLGPPKSEVQAVQRQLLNLMLFDRLTQQGDATYITADGFAQIFSNTETRWLKCNQGHGLQRKKGRGSRSLRECDNCKEEIDNQQDRLTCKACDYDLCLKCATKKSRVGWQKNSEKQWSNCEQVLHVMCASHANVKQVMNQLEKAVKKETVDKETFCNVMSKMLRMNAEWTEKITDLWDALFDYLHELGASGNEMHTSHIALCMKVVDSTRTQAAVEKARNEALVKDAPRRKSAFANDPQAAADIFV